MTMPGSLLQLTSHTTSSLQLTSHTASSRAEDSRTASNLAPSQAGTTIGTKFASWFSTLPPPTNKLWMYICYCLYGDVSQHVRALKTKQLLLHQLAGGGQWRVEMVGACCGSGVQIENPCNWSATSRGMQTINPLGCASTAGAAKEGTYTQKEGGAHGGTRLC